MISNSQSETNSPNQALETALGKLAVAGLPRELEALRALMPPQGTVARVIFEPSQEQGGTAKAVIVYIAVAKEGLATVSTPTKPDTPVFHPVTIRGEPLSATIIAERR